MTGELTTKRQDKNAGIQAVKTAVAGSTYWPDIADEIPTFDGAALDAAFTAADQAAAADPENFALRMQAAYAYAIARDYHYSVAASPRFFYGRGAHETIRNLYEVSIIDTLATTPAS